MTRHILSISSCYMLCFVAHLAPPTGLMAEQSLTLLSPPPDNELTVGKVYAALMIFDYYKHTCAKRLQQQHSTGGPQVQCVVKKCACEEFRGDLVRKKNSATNFNELENVLIIFLNIR